MKRLLIVIGLLLSIILIGCNNKSEEVMSFRNIVTEKMGVEVFIPEYQDLEPYVAYIIFNDDGKPQEVNIQYSKSKGSLNKEHARQMETELNVDLLYGPFEVAYEDVSVVFSFVKKGNVLDNIGKKINVGDIELYIQDKVDNNNFQHYYFLVGDHQYHISYQLNHFSEEEALEQTKIFIEDLHISKKSETAETITDDRPKLLIIKDGEGNELASNIDMTVGSATVSKSKNGNFILEAEFKDSQKLYNITNENIGKELDIYFKDELIFKPKVISAISNGSFAIASNQLNENELKNIADTINDKRK